MCKEKIYFECGQITPFNEQVYYEGKPDKLNCLEICHKKNCKVMEQLDKRFPFGKINNIKEIPNKCNIKKYLEDGFVISGSPWGSREFNHPYGRIVLYPMLLMNKEYNTLEDYWEKVRKLDK